MLKFCVRLKEIISFVIRSVQNYVPRRVKQMIVRSKKLLRRVVNKKPVVGSWNFHRRRTALDNPVVEKSLSRFDQEKVVDDFVVNQISCRRDLKAINYRAVPEDEINR